MQFGAYSCEFPSRRDLGGIYFPHIPKSAHRDPFPHLYFIDMFFADVATSGSGSISRIGIESKACTLLNIDVKSEAKSLRVLRLRVPGKYASTPRCTAEFLIIFYPTSRRDGLVPLVAIFSKPDV